MPWYGWECSLCGRTFGSGTALQQHIRDARGHHVCHVCNRMYSDWESLTEHARDVDHGSVCTGCRDGQGTIWFTQSAYEEHLQDHNVCQSCERHFSSPTNLHSHKLTHLSRTVECYACTAKYPTLSAMLLHIDGGFCTQATRQEINQLAAQCYQHKKYTNAEWRQELLDMDDWHGYAGTPTPFYCSDCGKDFTKLSALFQHAESLACDLDVRQRHLSKLDYWLRMRLPC